jgi:serine/threonine protein kinase
VSSHGELTHSAAPHPGALGGDRLREEIARGGMGAFYLADDTTLGREVAVKVPQERFAPDSPVARRFFGEAHKTTRIQAA